MCGPRSSWWGDMLRPREIWCGASPMRAMHRQPFVEPPQPRNHYCAHVDQELRETSEILEQITGRRSAFSARLLERDALCAADAKRLGMTPVMWNAMTRIGATLTGQNRKSTGPQD